MLQIRYFYGIRIFYDYDDSRSQSLIILLLKFLKKTRFLVTIYKARMKLESLQKLIAYFKIMFTWNTELLSLQRVQSS